jgi:hypothetical protein
MIKAIVAETGAFFMVPLLTFCLTDLESNGTTWRSWRISKVSSSRSLLFFFIRKALNVDRALTIVVRSMSELYSDGDILVLKSDISQVGYNKR